MALRVEQATGLTALGDDAAIAAAAAAARLRVRGEPRALGELNAAGQCIPALAA